MIHALRLLLPLCLLAGLAPARAAERKPNIIFIMADDLGWTDLAVQGSKYYETPNIDRLAAQGTRLMSYHHCQNCQPTRAALMSGQYAPRTGIYTVGGIERFDWQSRPLRPVDNVTALPLDKITIAQSLKAAGYATGMFGKWHLGEDEAHHPVKRGFDEAIVSKGKHFDFNTKPKVEYPKGAYLADFLTDQASDFIRRHKDGPFFLYLPHFGVHSPAKPLASDDGADVLAGWKLRGVKATTSGDGVRLELDGRNPFLGTAKYKFTGAAEVKLRVRAPAGGPGQVHWRLAQETEFAAEHAVKFDLAAGDEWRDAAVPLPAQGSIVQVRLFLPADKGVVEVSTLDVRGGAAKSRKK